MLTIDFHIQKKFTLIKSFLKNVLFINNCEDEDKFDTLQKCASSFSEAQSTLPTSHPLSLTVLFTVVLGRLTKD